MLSIHIRIMGMDMDMGMGGEQEFRPALKT